MQPVNKIGARSVTQRSDLAQQARDAQFGIGAQALLHIRRVGLDDARARLARALQRRFQATLDVLANGLAI
jgi:hypothetical protein